MTKLQHLQQTKQWAEGWLAQPAESLPGTLTHDKCLEVLEDVEDQLIEHMAIQVKGQQTTIVYVD